MRAYLPLWRPTKSHPVDFVLKQIINSDAPRHHGWSILARVSVSVCARAGCKRV